MDVVQQQPVAIVTPTSFDRRALYVTEPLVLANSLLNLSFMASTATAMATTHLSDKGALELVIRVMNRLAGRHDSLASLGFSAALASTSRLAARGTMDLRLRMVRCGIVDALLPLLLNTATRIRSRLSTTVAVMHSDAVLPIPPTCESPSFVANCPNGLSQQSVAFSDDSLDILQNYSSDELLDMLEATYQPTNDCLTHEAPNFTYSSQIQSDWSSEDLVNATKLICYVSKYHSVRDILHDTYPVNIYSLVEMLTCLQDMPEVKQWADVCTRISLKRDGKSNESRRCAYLACAKANHKDHPFVKCSRCYRVVYCR